MYATMMTLPLPARHAPTETIDQRAARVMELHLHPRYGSRFWLERAASLGLSSFRPRNCEELAALGTVSIEDLRRRPVMDYVPLSLHGRAERLIVAQTGGTTGVGTWTAYRDDEFHEAFVAPFVSAADALNFPRGEAWLFVGPTGPHIIGKAVSHLAGAMDSAEPFMVDFDPRWAKRLTEGSFARQRYLSHVIEQAMNVIDTQEVGVLFTTPPVLGALEQAMTEPQRLRIRGVHYGGLALSPETLLHFQTEVFPKALHLSGYGNTLFGCALELSAAPGRQLDYFPHGQRLRLEVVDEQGNPAGLGRAGRVRISRLDESMAILGLVERDVAEAVECPAGAAPGFSLPGLRNPHTPAGVVPSGAAGLY